MVTTTQILPSLALRPFVRSYVYREFDTHGELIYKPCHATHESNLIFFFDQLPIQLTEAGTGKVLTTGSPAGICGVNDRYVGEMSFKGRYAFLQVMFRPNGFYKIFGIPSQTIRNAILGPEDVVGDELYRMQEILARGSSFETWGPTLDSWLARELAKHRLNHADDPISVISTLLARDRFVAGIDKLAAKANMSVRNFERRFADEIGISAKQLICVTRFNHALQLKLRNPRKNWMTVVNQAGYFDHNHLAKDFKKFTGQAPVSLFKDVTLFEESFMNTIIH